MRAPPRADAPTSARGTRSRELHVTVPAVLIPCMDKFIEQHADRITGTLGCFDRVLFRGYLPIMSGAAMATAETRADPRSAQGRPSSLLANGERTPPGPRFPFPNREKGDHEDAHLGF